MNAGKKKIRSGMQRVAAWVVVIAMIMLTGGGFLGYLAVGRRSDGGDARQDVADEVLDRVQIFADQGGAHIPDGEHFTEYNSNPPTSGPHYAKPAPWGVYEEALPDEELVHNLEHCGIWISYRPDIPEAEKTRIASYGRNFPSKVIVTPRQANEAPIALVAWRRMLTMEQFSEREADAFVSAFLNKAGPECNAL